MPKMETLEQKPVEQKKLSTRRNTYKNKSTSKTNFLRVFGKPIEEFDSIKRAVECVREITKRSYYWELPNYFLFLKEDPDQVIANRRKDINSVDSEQMERYERLTRVYVRILEEKKYSGRSIKSRLGRVMGFFSNNSKRYALDLGRLIISKARKKQKYSPTNEEVRHLYAFADSARDRLIILLMYQNGLVPVDISQLAVGDLPKEPWTYYEKSRSKTGEVWRGVITPEISHELKALLKLLGNPEPERTNKNGYERNQLIRGRQGPLDSQAISQIVQGLIRKSGLAENDSFKPTSLRDGCEDSLVEANVNHKIKEAIMGHTSDIEHQYGGHNRLVISVVEAMKKAYPFLAMNGCKEEAGLAKNEIAELKARLEQRDLEISRVIEDKNKEMAELKNKIQRTELLKPVIETLLKRVEEIETKLRTASSN
ncbi:MAG: tyrosine-type recombinase/integrase [Candidatus Bathyarchaeia archaeon]